MGKGIAYQRTEPKRRDLAVALDELLAGKDVSTADRRHARVACIGRVKKPVADSDVTYANHDRGHLQRELRGCHRAGQIAPFPLTTYDEAVGWAEMIREVVQRTAACLPGTPIRRSATSATTPAERRRQGPDRQMGRQRRARRRPVESACPAPHVHRGLADSQARRGDLHGRRALRSAGRADGRVSAVRRRSGLDRRQVDPGDRVRAGQSRHRASHHRVPVPPGVAPSGQAGRLQTTGWAPLPRACARSRCPRATPATCRRARSCCSRCTTRPTASRSRTAALPASCLPIPSTVKKEVAVQNAGNFTFKIPPQDPNYEVESEFVFRQNATLLTIVRRTCTCAARTSSTS